jgi:hypothetical protein
MLLNMTVVQHVCKLLKCFMLKLNYCMIFVNDHVFKNAFFSVVQHNSF